MSVSNPDLLRGLSPADAAGVMDLGERLALSSGATLFRLGDDADRLFVVGRGRIALTLPIVIGGRAEHVLVEERQPGEALGWSALVPPHRFTLDAAASVDTELIAFRREALLAHFAAHPAVGAAVALNVAAVIGHRLQLFQAMWAREIQHVVELRYPVTEAAR